MRTAISPRFAIRILRIDKVQLYGASRRGHFVDRGQFENRGQTDLSTRRKNGALGQIRQSPLFKLAKFKVNLPDMKTLLMCLPWLVICLFAQDSDEAAVRAVVQKYVDARETIDARAVEALFTSDADQLVSSGEWRKGRSEVVRGTMASSQNTGGKRTVTVESVRFIKPDAAIADGRYEISGLSGGATRKMWSTFVLARGADGWRIAAIRNMLPAAAAPSR